MTLKCANNALWVTLFALNSATFVHAQFGRGGGDWLAIGGDAQRSASVKTDPQISVASVQAGVMQSLWKVKLNGAPKPLLTLWARLLEMPKSTVRISASAPASRARLIWLNVSSRSCQTTT